MTTKNIQEFRASGEDSTAADPIDTGNVKRRGDKTLRDTTKMTAPTPPKSKSAMVLDLVTKAIGSKKPHLADAWAKIMDAMGTQGVSDNAAASNYASIKSRLKEAAREDLAEILANVEGLTEQTIDEILTVVESSVALHVNTIIEELEEEYQAAVETTQLDLEEEIKAHLDDYISYVAKQWLEENKLEVARGIRGDLAESFMAGIRQVFEEHYIDVPDDKLDIVQEMADEIEDLRSKLNEQVHMNVELSKRLDEEEVDEDLEEVFESVAEGLTESQTEKLRIIAEDLTVESAEEFHDKLQLIRTNMFEGNRGLNRSADSMLNEDADDRNNLNVHTTDVEVAPEVASVISSIRRTIR